MIKTKLWPVIFIGSITCLIFFKIFTKGLYPIPADLLVSFYFPWYSGGWAGYNPWTTHKEMLGSDSIRQIYPWKEFAMEEFKKGQLPLWNPYTFSGQPLAANFQSSVYYPFNVFYFLTDAKNAWILLIVIQPFLGGIFMYLLIKSLQKSTAASLFAAIAFMFSSYLVTWMENGNVSHSYIWLPLSFWAIIGYFKKPIFRHFLVLTFSLALSVLGGHPQTAIYVYLSVFIFWIYKTWEIKRGSLNNIFIISLSFATSILISAIQLIPTYAFYKISPISLPFSKEVFDRAILPYKNLTTFFASDFFGHPANNNFWSQTYGDFTPYFGVIPLIFALWAIYKFWGARLTKFLSIASILFIFSSVHGPITSFIKVAQIPLIDATTPSRFISLSIFFLIVLSALGVDDFLKNSSNKKYLKKFFYFLIPVAAIYSVLWLFAIFGQFFLSPKETWQENLAVTRRNLILPTLMFLSLGFLSAITHVALSRAKLSKIFLRNFFITYIFLITLVGGIYYTNKFLPVAPKHFIFPDHPLFTWLKSEDGLNRFYGRSTAYIDFNFPTHYRVYGAEGYDTLRLERYAQLLASSYTGYVPETYLRSDAVFPNEENGYRKRLFELLGIKYLLDKEDTPKTGNDWNIDERELIWQDNVIQVYRRHPVLPRIFLTSKYYIAKDDEDIIKKIYDQNHDLQQIILEKEPNIKIREIDKPIIVPEIIKYNPTSVALSSAATYNSLLFISDAYDKDWKVYIDGIENETLRAHYALRAVAVPAGIHDVVFKYEPKSFVIGAFLTFISIAIVIITSLILFLKKKF